MPPLNFRTSMMQKEYESLIVKDGGVEGTLISVQRPKEQLLSFQPKKIVKPTTIEEWNDSNAIEQAKSQFESERIRSQVIEVEKEEGVANWTRIRTIKSRLSTSIISKESIGTYYRGIEKGK